VKSTGANSIDDERHLLEAMDAAAVGVSSREPRLSVIRPPSSGERQTNRPLDRQEPEN